MLSFNSQPQAPAAPGPGAGPGGGGLGPWKKVGSVVDFANYRTFFGPWSMGLAWVHAAGVLRMTEAVTGCLLQYRPLILGCRDARYLPPPEALQHYPCLMMSACRKASL